MLLHNNFVHVLKKRNFTNYLQCNSLVDPDYVRLLVGLSRLSWMVGRSVGHLDSSFGKFHFHAPIKELVMSKDVLGKEFI